MGSMIGLAFFEVSGKADNMFACWLVGGGVWGQCSLSAGGTILSGEVHMVENSRQPDALVVTHFARR